MKISFYFLGILGIGIFCQCTNHLPVISDDSFQKMHLIIERTVTDTVKVKFENFILENRIPLSATSLKPGIYKGESAYDDYGYKHVISFKVENGRFSEISYDEIKENGQGKIADTSYCNTMNETHPGSGPAISYPIYVEQLESKQDLGKIDAVTGATYSKYRLQYAAIRAILKGPVHK